MNNPEPNTATPFPQPPAYANAFPPGQYAPLGPPVSAPPAHVSGPPMQHPTPGNGRARGPGTVVATVVAVLALIVAAGALAVAWRSLDRARDARDIALSGRAQPGPQPTADQPTGPTGNDPTPGPPPATDVPADPTGTGEPRARGDVQRMVLLEVTGVGPDKAVTVQVTAWDIPR